MSVTPLIGATKIVNGVPLVPEVVGGSGREYFSPQQGLDLETSQVFLDTTVAGTTNGIVKTSAGFIPSDGFYDGMKLVVTDLAAVNGGIAEVATIIRSTAATDLLALDRPINVTAGKTYAIINEKKIALNGSFKDAVLSVTADAEINLGGNTVKEINVTGAVRYLRVLNGVVRNGVNWASTAVGAFIGRDAKVGWRSGTLGDAIRMVPTVGAYSLELYDCDIDGRVSGNSIQTRWILNNVTNPGFAGAEGTNGFSVVNARGVALAPTNVSIVADRVDGTIAVYHAESGGGITLGTFTDMRCNIGGWPIVSADTSVPAKQVSIGQVDDTSTMALSISDLASFLSANIQENGDFAVLRCRASSGAASITPAVAINLQQFMGDCSIIKTEGACSGAKTVTPNGNWNFDLTDAVNMLGFLFTGAWTGAGSIPAGTGSITAQDAARFSPIEFRASQVAGAPTATYAPTTFLLGVGFINIFHLASGVTVSAAAAAWTVSAQLWGKKIDAYHCTLPTILADETTAQGTVTGSAWTRSGDDDMGMATPGDSVIRRARNGGTTVTLIASGNARFFGGGHIGTQTCTALTATATTVTSGSTLYFGMAFQGFGGFAMIANAAVAGAVATCSGNPFYDKCNFYDTGMFGTISVGSVTVPAALAIRDCFFVGTFFLRVGAGAYAGACSVFTALTEFGGLVTINGTNFTSWQSETCVFFGSPDSLAFVTVDPTFFLFLYCSFFGRSHLLNGSLTLGKPIKVNASLAENSGAVTTDERLGKYNSTARLVDLALTTDNILCVFQLGGTGGAGGNQFGIVDGWGFVVAADASINQGDALGPEAAGSRVVQASIKRVGYALDATAFPTASNDRVYARIHVDR